MPGLLKAIFTSYGKVDESVKGAFKNLIDIMRYSGDVSEK